MTSVPDEEQKPDAIQKPDEERTPKDVRILVVGAGATGGYFGGRLAAAGRDVTFLVRPGRAAELAGNGLQIVSEHGDLTLRPAALTVDRIDHPFDLILLCVKAYGLDQAMADIAAAVGDHTLILPMLNGLQHIDRLTERFGRSRVLGGVCVVSVTLDEQSRVIQLAGMQELTYGRLPSDELPEHDPTGTEPAIHDDDDFNAADSALQGAGFSARPVEKILPAMWQKWVMLASVGAYNCLMRGNVGEIVAAAGGITFAEALLAETASVAAASGHPLREVGRQFIATLMTTPGSSFSSSMYRDLQAGQRVEVDAIIGDMVARADGLGVPTPLLRLALLHLTVYQDRLDRT